MPLLPNAQKKKITALASKAIRISHLALWMCLPWLIFGGCRTLQRSLPDGHLVRARQLSLRGADLLRRSRLHDAETLFAEALQHCPTDERAHWGYATILWEKGQPQAAIGHMREAIRLSGSNPEYVVRLGQMYLAEGNAAAAEEQARQVLKSHRDRADAWALLGDSQFRQEAPHAAMESYHRALLLQPDYPQVQLAVAETYRVIGRPNRALATLDRMVDIRPSQCHTGETQLLRAQALIDLGRREEALTALRAVGDSLPIDQPDRQLQLAYGYFQVGELVDARMSLGKILQAYPDRAEALALQSRLDHSFEYLAEHDGPSLQR
jgi:tetratricopeptide (TPR) repeat protein